MLPPYLGTDNLQYIALLFSGLNTLKVPIHWLNIGQFLKYQLMFAQFLRLLVPFCLTFLDQLIEGTSWETVVWSELAATEPPDLMRYLITMQSAAIPQSTCLFVLLEELVNWLVYFQLYNLMTNNASEDAKSIQSYSWTFNSRGQDVNAEHAISTRGCLVDSTVNLMLSGAAPGHIFKTH